LDDASTFFVALRPLRDIPAVAMTFHSQPPLFYWALHAWLGLGDTEPVLRALPLLFMIGAAVTLFTAAWLSPVIRVVAGALLLLTPYSEYLTGALRPYALSVWFSLWSSLLFIPLLTGARRHPSTYLGYTIVTGCLAYTTAMASWVLFAQGVCAVAGLALAVPRRGARPALADHAGLFLSLAAIALLYLPYVIGVWRLQGRLGHPSLAASVAAAVNPRYFVSGPVYLLSMPGGLGYLAVAAIAVALWSGVTRRDPLVGVLATLVLLQIAMTHGFLEGRSPFGFRYLAPAYPALCVLAGVGVDRMAARVRSADLALTVFAASVLAASIATFARAPHAPPVGAWRQVAADLRLLAGAKFVFFDTGWDAQRLQYEVRHDPDVRVLSDAGSGWDTGGRTMTPAYVTDAIDRYTGSATMFFYQFDPVTRADVFDRAFAPAMARHRCARVYQREVPTYERSLPGDGGAQLYGYACHGA
jgi:hypothetical protein